MIALPMTVALLFLMTRLILPDEQDRIVARMIQRLELQRADSPPEPPGIQVFKLPPPGEDKAPVVKPNLTAASSVEENPVHVIDWWAEARKLTEEFDEEELKRWLLEQGYDRYVSIMQGPLPITNSVRGTLPPTQEDITGYRNTYGDMELKISENCVLQTQVSARNDASDFARNLPMRVVCKSAPKVKLKFDRGARE